MKELVAWAKAHPDKSNYGTSAPPFTIASELLKLKTGMPGVGIPFKSSNEFNLCVVSEQCLFTISDGPPSIPLVKGGKTRALAVTGSERSPELPDVPSMAEAGYPEINTHLWSGFFVPAGTPAAVVAKLHGGTRRARSPIRACRRACARWRSRRAGRPATEFAKRIDADIAKFGEVVKAAHLTFQ